MQLSSQPIELLEELRLLVFAMVETDGLLVELERAPALVESHVDIAQVLRDHGVATRQLGGMKELDPRALEKA